MSFRSNVSIQGQGHSLTLAHGHLQMKIKTCFFSLSTGPFLTKFCMQAIGYMEMKIYRHDAGHMTKTAVTSIYGKNPTKIFFSRTSGLALTKPGM